MHSRGWRITGWSASICAVVAAALWVISLWGWLVINFSEIGVLGTGSGGTLGASFETFHTRAQIFSNVRIVYYLNFAHRQYIAYLPEFHWYKGDSFGIWIPAWWFVLLLAAVAVIGFLKGKRRAHNNCPHCGYDKRGNTTDRCPECGALVADVPV